MKRLVDAFLDLPTGPAILLIVALVGIVVAVALIVSHFSFRAGERYAEERFAHISNKRRDRESIV